MLEPRIMRDPDRPKPTSKFTKSWKVGKLSYSAVKGG